jgi:hypothetical protein
MDFNQQDLLKTTRFQIDCCDRWQVYHRLMALELSCTCGAYQPLDVDIPNPTTAILVWSVVHQIHSPRLTLVDWLDRCWLLDGVSDLS